MWVCVLGLGLRLRPGIPGWGFGAGVFFCALGLYSSIPGSGVRCGCVCLRSGFGCAMPVLVGVLGCVFWCLRSVYTPQILAELCSVGVCAWARVSAAPRHSWPSCCVVCLCALSARTPPLLAGVCGEGVCVWARVPAASRLSWLGSLVVCFGVCAPPVPRQCWLGCAVWVCVFRPGFGCAPPFLAGVLGCVFWCVRCSCTLPILAGVCGVGACAWAQVSAAPRHSWLGFWGGCVFVRAPSVPRQSRLGCAVWLCVLGLGFWLRPAIPDSDFGVCVCVFVCALRLYLADPGCGARCGWVCLGLGFGCAPPFLAGVLGCVFCCVRSACSLPILARVCGVVVCAWARVSAAFRHSWLGCWVVCFGECAPPVPRQSWLGYAVLVCVFCPGLGCAPRFLATVLGCVFWCVRTSCTPPILAGVCGVGMCAWARVSAAPHHSWLGCWGLCVFVCALLLYPTNPGWGVQCGFLSLGSGFGYNPLFLAGVFGCVCVFECALRLYPANPGSGAQCWCVCLCSGFGFLPPLLAPLLRCVCRCAPSACTLPFLAGVLAGVPGLEFLLRPAIAG